MKKRLMIQLDDEDHRALRSWARAAGVSMSGAVRMLIRERLHGTARPEVAAKRFLEAAGTLHERGKDRAVSANHDDALYGFPKP